MSMIGAGPRKHALAADGSEARRIDKAEIAEVVQSVVVTLRGDLSARDLSLYQEVEGLARFIRHAKAEIAALHPDEIKEKHLPTATDELDAIVGATEEATHIILDSVEKIESTANSLGGEAKESISGAVTKIYEACNFQDITGQRISKVVRALKQIETKVAALVRAFGAENESKMPVVTEAGKPPSNDGSIDESALLNGPQLPGNANSQADIDAMFGSK